MAKRDTIPGQDNGESQKPASWFVSTPLASGSDLPTGTVTFLFSDIEGGTPRWEHHPELVLFVLAAVVGPGGVGRTRTALQVAGCGVV